MAETIQLKGRIRWTQRLFTPDTFENKSFWSVLFVPNRDELDTILTLQGQGVKNVLKKDGDDYTITYKRPTEKKMKGEVVKFDPPVVIGPDGKQLTDNTIGNDSKATVTLTVYEHRIPGSTRKAKAVRLDKVEITELVPYEQKNSEETKSESYY